jgi:hypothetical protein
MPVQQEADALGPVCVLVAVFRVALRLHHMHVFPVGIQLVGQHHCQAGPDAGAISDRDTTIVT